MTFDKKLVIYPRIHTSDAWIVAGDYVRNYASKKPLGVSGAVVYASNIMVYQTKSSYVVRPAKWGEVDA